MFIGSCLEAQISIKTCVANRPWTLEQVSNADNLIISEGST